MLLNLKPTNSGEREKERWREHTCVQAHTHTQCPLPTSATLASQMPAASWVVFCASCPAPFCFISAPLVCLWSAVPSFQFFLSLSASLCHTPDLPSLLLVGRIVKGPVLSQVGYGVVSAEPHCILQAESQDAGSEAMTDSSPESTHHRRPLLASRGLPPWVKKAICVFSLCCQRKRMSQPM